MLAERGSEDAEVEMRLVRADSSGVAIGVDCVDAILSPLSVLQSSPLYLFVCLSVFPFPFPPPFVHLLRVWNARRENVNADCFKNRG